jgi:chitin disaccharide deacetylase
MGVGWLPGLRERLAELAEREGLVDAHSFRSLPAIESAAEDLVSMWLAWIDGASAGTYVLITHPGIDEEEMRRFGDEPGVVARERDAERRALTDARLAGALRARGVEIVRYTDVA